MLRSDVVIVGGVKAGTVAEICARFRPELKPATNAALELVAAVCALPARPGANRPVVTNVFFSGGLVSNRVAVVPGKMSANMPTPPRMTVLPCPNGCQAKPRRGCQLTFWKFGSAECSPVRMAWLY